MEFKLSNIRYEEIIRIIIEMFIRYKITTVPVSGFEIAHKMGVKVIPYSAFPPWKRGLLLKQSKDGFSVEKKSGEWFIFYNDILDYGRVNNTIMHEIGHIVLGHSEDSELAEKEAKFFAKYALAPPALVHSFNIKNPSQIKAIFDISYEAACYAYNYYQKWLKYGGVYYKDYELRLLALFQQAG